MRQQNNKEMRKLLQGFVSAELNTGQSARFEFSMSPAFLYSVTTALCVSQAHLHGQSSIIVFSGGSRSLTVTIPLIIIIIPVEWMVDGWPNEEAHQRDRA